MIESKSRQSFFKATLRRQPVIVIFASMGGSIRQKKMGRLIQKELSAILQFDRVEGASKGGFISVTEVEMSPDLELAKVYLSVAFEADKEAALERLNRRKKEIRKSLGRQIGKQVRKIPELALYIDDAEERSRRIDDLIKGLHIPPPSDEGASADG